MHLPEKTKNLISCAGFALQGIWHCEKGYFAYSALAVLTGVAVPLVLVKIPGYLIEYLLEGDMRTPMILALVLCAVIFANSVSTDRIKRRKILLEEQIKAYFTKEAGLHLMKIDFQQLEKPELLNEYQFSVTCIDEKRPTKLIGEMETFCASLATMLGVVSILAQLDAVVIVLLLLVVTASAVSESFRMRHVYDRHKTETPAQRQLLYARNDLVKKEYAKEIRIFNLKNYVVRKVEFYAQKMCDLWKSAAVKSVRTVGWTYLLQAVQLAAAYLYLAHNALNGSISIADFTVYIAAVTTFGAASAKLVNTFIHAADASKYIQSLRDFLSLPLPGENGCLSRTENNAPEGPYTIQLEDVSFRYPNCGEDAVSHVSLTIEPETKYAIVGENGAGKTTFIKLLMGLYTPTSGKITVNGVNVNTIDNDRYRELFSAVFQDYHILGFRLDENVAFGRDMDSGRVQQAIGKAGLADDVRSLSDREKTYMSTAYSPQGTEFSGGQKQKLAIARALYKDAPIMILDEPTASLSPQSEFELYRSFQQITHHKSVIYISHRFASCRLCDTIFVFSQGALAECGSHEELMARNGIYKEMFVQQAKLYQESTEDAAEVINE